MSVSQHISKASGKYLYPHLTIIDEETFLEDLLAIMKHSNNLEETFSRYHMHSGGFSMLQFSTTQ